MARFRADEAEHYGGSGGAGYFSLKNDKDVARVRFLYNGIEDVEGYSVHQVEINGRNRYVNCLREYDQPVEDCPLCREKNAPKAKVFIPLYNIDEDQIQIWDRGKKFFAILSSYCSRYPNLVSHTIEIERNGKTGDTNTTYQLYETGQDDTTLEDFEIPEIVGGVVLDKSAEDMEYYLQEGQFPPVGDEEIPQMRRRGREEKPEEEAPRRRTSSTSSRRTPASGGSRRSEF